MYIVNERNCKKRTLHSFITKIDDDFEARLETDFGYSMFDSYFRNRVYEN